MFKHPLKFCKITSTFKNCLFDRKVGAEIEKINDTLQSLGQ